MRLVLQFAPAPHTPTDSTGADGAASPATRSYSRPVPEFRELAEQSREITGRASRGVTAMIRRGGQRPVADSPVDSRSSFASGGVDSDMLRATVSEASRFERGGNSYGRTGISGLNLGSRCNSGPLASISPVELLALRDAFALVINYQSNSKRNDPVRDWLNTEFYRIHFAVEGL